MTRDDLAAIAKKHAPQGHRRGHPLPAANLNAAEAEITAYFHTPEGQSAIAKGPPWHRGRTPEELARLLLSELPWMVE